MMRENGFINRHSEVISESFSSGVAATFRLRGFCRFALFLTFIRRLKPAATGSYNYPLVIWLKLIG
jgi:hypothetical protein